MEATNRVYVGNLDPSVTQQEMEAETRRFGETTSVWVARSPPGFAFIEFAEVRDAQACIDGLDHHCPWMGKCVGAGNLRYFRLFNWSWLTYSLYMCVCIALKESGVGS